MKVVKCKNNHFFDHDTFDRCPQCGAEIAVSANITDDGNQKKHFLFHYRQKSMPAPVPSPAPDSAPVANQLSSPIPVSAPTTESIPILSAKPSQINLSVEQEKATESFWNGEEKTNSPNDRSNNQGNKNMGDVDNNDHNTEPTSELFEEIKKSSASSGEKTVSYFNAMISDSKTEKSTNEPVVGWLVCVDGNHFGESFSIISGRNSIGRNDSNQVVLNKESSVSREKHAFIVYEPKKKNFYLQPGDCNGLTYLNDDYITETKKISDKDIIEVGDCKLIFVQLCGENFSWEKYISEE